MNADQNRRGKPRGSIKGFDSHVRGDPKSPPARPRGSGGRRRAVAVFAARRYFTDPRAPHFRAAARMFALPGNHLRAPARPPKAAHCTTDA